MEKVLYKNVEIELLGHDSIRILGNDKYIYIDPCQLDMTQAMPKANLILISHSHADHCSPEDLRLITTPETIIITVPDVLSKVLFLKTKDIKLMRPGDETRIGPITINAVSAYNIDKFKSPGIPFHAKENEWIGFIVNIGGTKIYFAGDTDKISEMNEFGPIDVALLPVSGTYVMTAEEASEAAIILKPIVAVPMHYGSIVGDKNDAEKFKLLLEGKGIRVEILD